MKHVETHEKKSCIFKVFDNFVAEMKFAFGDNISVTCDYEGLYFKQNGDYLDDNVIIEKLSNYYDVTVTSVHIDDFDTVGVWIVYVDTK